MDDRTSEAGARARQTQLFRQDRRKLLRALPVAALMAGVSGLLVVAGLRGAGPAALLGGGLGLTFFGPAFVILCWSLVRPAYLLVDGGGVRFRLHGLEGTIPWEEIAEVSAGMGWPSLVFHDCERAAGRVRFRGLRTLGWILEIPTRLVSLLLRRPIANMYPPTRRGLVSAFRSNERTFGFHYGLPTSLLDGSSRSMVAAMRRALDRHRRATRVG